MLTALVFLFAMILAGVLLYRIETVAKRLEAHVAKKDEEARQAAEDRKLTHDLLTTVKGWALVMEKHDAYKDKKIEEVAAAAEQTKVEIKQAITDAVGSTISQTATEVMKKLEEKAVGDSNSLLPKPVLGGT